MGTRENSTIFTVLSDKENFWYWSDTTIFDEKKVDETSINLAMMIRNHVPWIRIANNLDTTFRNEIFYYTCQQNSRNL